jgi:hypothetical protein
VEVSSVFIAITRIGLDHNTTRDALGRKRKVSIGYKPKYHCQYKEKFKHAKRRNCHQKIK